VNGAESLIRTSVQSGVEVCFTNPGTTEMHVVGALDSVPGMRAVLGLFEGVCTGAADGYGRMTGKPALTLLHLGPGFANGIANLHNARRARTPIVNVVGDQATWHVANDAPLTSDIESLARPVSKWVRTTKTAADVSGDTAAAIAAALSPATGVSTLIVPADCAWDATSDSVATAAVESRTAVDEAQVVAAAAALGSGEPAALLLGDGALTPAALQLAGRIAASTGCRMWCDTFIARIDRGRGIPEIEKIPYFPEQVQELLGGVAHLVLVGSLEPVAFFGYPGTPGRLVPDSCAVHALGAPGAATEAALAQLADRLGASAPAAGASDARPAAPTGDLSASTIGQAIAAAQPDGAIVMDEAATTGFPYWMLSRGCPPHSYMGLTGGAIGQGLPCATGAAVACPDRPVIAFQADGSGMYTQQSLWTQAREGLDVTTVICSNREYRILRVELGRADIAKPGPQADSLTRLSDPDIDWAALSQSMGVPGVTVDSAEQLNAELARAFAEPGPHLIEAVF
jgi:acetolactate synthase-1/2/3 large subunit